MTIFSKILAREIPADIVYEDDHALAFLDINPINPGHTLVIPKNPFTNIFDANKDELAHLMVVAQKVAQALIAAGLADGVNLTMNNGASAGQEVFHAHLHVIPRKENDGAYVTLKHTKLSREEMEAIAKQLGAVLAS